MALIGKIRKNFWFVLILLGLALAAFVLMDMTSAGNRGGGVRNLTLGEINGEKISYEDFQRTESAYYAGNTSDVYAKRKTIWDFYVENKLVKNESDNLGLSVSYDELMDLQFGENMSPIIRQNWTNPQTKQVDRAQLNQFKTAIENGEELNPQFRAYWSEQEKQVVKGRLQSKLNNIVSKGIYTPKWMAEEAFKEDNTKVDFSFVKIPFDVMEGNPEVSDADITNYLQENSDRFSNDTETRFIEFLKFDVTPSQQDSTDLLNRSTEIANNFKAAENDSLFALGNGGGYAPFYFSSEQLPAAAKESVMALSNGDVYGPYVDNGTYSIIKMIDKKVVPDTVAARHILRNADRTNITQLAAAQAFVDSLSNLISRGAQSFDSLAIKHSQDQGSGARGGDLGEFTQGSMVPEFNDVCFYSGKPGKLYSVVSQFGVHLIEIKDQKFTNREPKYKIASIANPIVPSEATQNAMYDKVADYVSEYRDLNSLRAAIESEGLEFEMSGALKENDYTIGTLGGGQASRDMIRWAYEETAEVGDVAPDVYSYTDPVNYFTNKYVIATLNAVQPAGLQSAATARSVVETAVKNQLKAKALASTLNVSSLTALAEQYEVSVEDANDISQKGGFIPGVGNEPEVIASAFSIPEQSLSKPIVGSSGLFIVSPKSKVVAGEPTNLPFVMQTVNQAARQQVSFKLIDALKNSADVSDKRATFF